MLNNRVCIDGERLSRCLIKELEENMPYLYAKDIEEFANQNGIDMDGKLFIDKTMLKENILDQLVWGKVRMCIDWDKLVLIHRKEWREQYQYFDELGIFRKNPYFAWEHFEKRMELRFNAPNIDMCNEKKSKRKEEYVNKKGISIELVFEFKSVEESEKIIMRYFIKQWNEFSKSIKSDKFIEKVCNQQKAMFEYCIQRAIDRAFYK